MPAFSAPVIATMAALVLVAWAALAIITAKLNTRLGLPSWLVWLWALPFVAVATVAALPPSPLNGPLILLADVPALIHFAVVVVLTLKGIFRRQRGR